MPDGLSVSRKAQRLLVDIDSSASSIERDCLKADLAIYKSRLGRYSEARRDLDGMRARNSAAPDVKRSIWINLAEGVDAYYSGYGISKNDGIQRSYALSCAAGLPELRALSAAWLSHWNYSNADISDIAAKLEDSFAHAGESSHSALSRANLVGALTLHYAGRADLAKPWYQRCNHHATLDGDDLTISAAMHNRVMQQMLNLRQVVLTGVGDSAVGDHLSMGAESTFTFDEIRGDTGWPGLKPLLRAQILSLESKFQQALDLYASTPEDDLTIGKHAPNITADQARCHVGLGNFSAAKALIAVALAALSETTDIDDRAATHSLAAIVFTASGDGDLASQHTRHAEAHWASHVGNQQQAVALLSPILQR